jgi:hypothetical protein
VFVGLGLSVFLTALHSWFYSFFFTALTLFFDLCGIFLLFKIGWRPFVASERGAAYRLLFAGLFVVWGMLLFRYFQGSDYARLVQEAQTAQREAADSGCSSSMLRVLSGLPKDFGPAYPRPEAASEGICKVQWMRVAGFDTHSCVVLEFAGRQADYCLGKGRGQWRFDWNGLQRGDMIVARTAFGQPSAFFLYPSRSVRRMLLSPRGEVVKTAQDPDTRYLWHLESRFMELFVYLLLGIAFPIRILT